MFLTSYFKKQIPDKYKKIIKKVYIKIIKIIHIDVYYFYDGNFSKGPLREKSWVHFFCDVILKDFNPKSIIDFGCATGDILKPFEDRRVIILGIDASRACRRHAKIKKTNFLLFDLRNKFKYKRKYDLCFCFEVAEHIEEKSSNRLVENLTQSSSTILFTAAPPGQEGLNHINLKHYDWWVKKFEEHGFYFDEQISCGLKEKIKNIPYIQRWYYDNLMVFKKLDIN